jgi:hypothetical protein
MNPNWDLGFENKPSGNPDTDTSIALAYLGCKRETCIPRAGQEGKVIILRNQLESVLEVKRWGQNLSLDFILWQLTFFSVSLSTGGQGCQIFLGA